MRRCFLFVIAFICAFCFQTEVRGTTPDSAYIFAYSTLKDGGRNGLHFAWSVDQEQWHPIGSEHSFLKSDYGAWGSQKRMYDPYLIKGQQGEWHCVWNLNDNDGTFAYSTSEDLIHWEPQVYPQLNFGYNCLLPVVAFDEDNEQYTISWLSDQDRENEYYQVSTSDFIHYSEVRDIDEADFENHRETVEVRGEQRKGTIHKADWKTIEELIDHQKLEAYNQQLYHETTDEDPQRFSDLEKVEADIAVDMSDYKSISDELIGVFFEDINYAADGGLYAELVQNRGFEYDPTDKKGNDPEWDSDYAWHMSGDNASFDIDSIKPVHPNNKHYAVVTTEKQGPALVNEGFNGIPLNEGEKYDFSMFGRVTEGNEMDVAVKLTGPNGSVLGETTVNLRSNEWEKTEAVIRSDQDIANARLELVPLSSGTIEMDMISLFPQNTFKGRENGLRADLARYIADLNPQFLRFPGGCVAHGDGIDNIYRWKNTIGPLEARKPQRNLWNYHQSMGLGFYEYFQFSEDIGAEPIPIVAAGVPCQNSSCGGAGQQGGIPLSDMDSYIQDVLDLIEWANGDKDSEWGRKRAEAGHPEPFGLKYLGVGNEDLISHVFEERFEMIYEAVKEEYPEIEVIGTVGPFSEGSDYRRGWAFARELGLNLVDEHYYQPPGWFIHNQDYYDKYSRSGPKVYLGEYAAHLPGRPRNVETALAEALYMTSLERNGDIVQMASYAPLLAREGNTQWNPDLIYFNNTEVNPTVGYFVQKLFGQNGGDIFYHSDIHLSDDRESVRKRVAVSVVRDTRTNDLILKMVNLLPAETDVQLNLEGEEVAASLADRTILSGDPDATEVRPVKDKISVGERFECVLPAYSFSLIRIDGKNSEKR